MRAWSLKRLGRGGAVKKCSRTRDRTRENRAQISRAARRAWIRSADGCFCGDADVDCRNDSSAGNQSEPQARTRKRNDLARKSVCSRDHDVLPQVRKVSDLARRFDETAAQQRSLHAAGVQRSDEQRRRIVAPHLHWPLRAIDRKPETAAHTDFAGWNSRGGGGGNSCGEFAGCGN